MSWSAQVGGFSCFFSGIHLDADSLYVKVPKSQFASPSMIADLDNYTDVLSKPLTIRKSMDCTVDTIEESLATEHSVETALGRGNNDEANLDPRIYWISDSYYTPPSHAKPALPTYLFGCASPSSIMHKLSSMMKFLKKRVHICITRRKTKPKFYLQRLCSIKTVGPLLGIIALPRSPMTEQLPPHMKPVMTKRVLLHPMVTPSLKYLTS